MVQKQQLERNVETLATQHHITVRRMDFHFDESISKYWFDNNPVLSMLANGLSAVFPEGERSFIRSVRRYQDRIKNPQLLAEVRAFIGQEAHHGKEHHDFNALMTRKGLPLLRISDEVKKGMAWEESVVSPARFLAHTCALEHFTAIFAEQVMEHPEYLDVMDERVRAMWLWHAIEESEHKSVAFDVFKDQVDSYWVRCSQMALTSVMFSFFTFFSCDDLLYIDGQLSNTKAMRKAMQYLWGRGKGKGLMHGLLPKYLAYYRRDFHPSQQDAQPLRDRAIALLNEWKKVHPRAA